MNIAPNKIPVTPAIDVHIPLSPTTGPKKARANVKG
jgi:hypothetical protein